MTTLSSDGPLRILVLKADRLYAESLREETRRIFPRAEITIAAHTRAAAILLSSQAFDLLLTGIKLPDGDALDTILAHIQGPQAGARVMVVSGHRDYRVFVTLRALQVAGLFDSAIEGWEQFRIALCSVCAGKRYWSRSSLEYMMSGIAIEKALCRKLTPSEQLVFSMIGDGCDDEEGAERLGLKASTITSVRREIHRKLGARHRGELVRIAVQSGYVRFIPDGVIRPGFELLLQARQPANKAESILVKAGQD